MERRERNPDTGEYIIQGEGIFDVVKNVGSKLYSKLTENQTICQFHRFVFQVVYLFLEKGSEKIGEKTGQLIGDKIYKKRSR